MRRVREADRGAKEERVGNERVEGRGSDGGEIERGEREVQRRGWR